MSELDRSRARRRVLKAIVTAAAVAPLARTSPSRSAEAAELVSESDSAAAALKYRADANKSPDRKNPDAYCDNCNYYTGKPGAPSGACAALGNRLVAAKGWCTSWEGY